jgi:hypothetical protein
MIKQALQYAERGWPIFPCEPKGKKPIVKAWQDVATTDEQQIREWWGKTPYANIGMVCGKASGIAVIDVDVSEKGNGYRELEALDIDEWETYYQQTPRGGRHFFFHVEDKCIKNAVGFFGRGSCVDVRGEGGYVLLAPSTTENGCYTAEDMDFEPFPDVFIRDEKEARATVDISHINIPEVALKYDKRLDEAEAYLRSCHPAIQGDEGHVALLIVARDLVWGYILKCEEAIDALWRVYNPRCIPPWDAGDTNDAKDFERKVYEAFKHPPLAIAGYKLSVVQQELEALAKALAQGKTVKESLGEPEPEIVYDLKETPYSPIKVRKVDEVTMPSKYDPIATMKRDYENGLTKEQLCVPPGMVGELADFISETAGKCQPFLALGASLSAHGAAMGRQFRDEDDTRTNMYCIGVAPSSAGKDHPTKMIDNLLVEAGADEMIGGSDVTSDSALIQWLNNMVYKSGGILIWDECGHILANIKGGAHGKSGATVVPTLMRLYSCAARMYRHKLMSNETERINIMCPHLCLWGVTTHSSLFDGLDMKSMRDGFMGRILPFESKLNPVYKGGMQKDFPADIVGHFAMLYNMTKEVAGLDGMPKMHTIVETPGATKCREDFATKCERMMIALGDDKSYLWGKAHENCRKIALTIAGGMPKPKIDYEVMDYAVQLTRLLVMEYQSQVDENMFEGIHEKEMKSIRHKLHRKFGYKWFSKSDISKVTQHYSPKDRPVYRVDFIDPNNGWVVLEEDKSGGYTGRIKLQKM